MAKPRIFISSTCYDLNHARAALTGFLESYDFEVLNSQKGSFGVTPKRHSHQACLDEVENSDFVILIIGGRRGGTFVGSERSITNEEYSLAIDLNIPLIAFVDKGVNSQIRTYKRNPQADLSHVVDDKRVFDFIDLVSSGHEDNWLHEFDNVQDIIGTLKSQFAHYLGVYSKGIRKNRQIIRKEKAAVVDFPAFLTKNLKAGDAESVQRTNDLRIVYDSLLSIISSEQNDASKEEQLKTIWVLARYGDVDEKYIELKEARFRTYAWGTSKGNRVFSQMEGGKIQGEYAEGYDHNGGEYLVARIKFGKKGDAPAYELQQWVKGLVKKYGDDGIKLFKNLDMRVLGDGK